MYTGKYMHTQQDTNMNIYIQYTQMKKAQKKSPLFSKIQIIDHF